MVPGVIALLLLLVTANLSSMAIVRERELGTLEQLNVTPLGRWELILGKLLPYAVLGFIDVLLVMAVAVYWFSAVSHARHLAPENLKATAQGLFVSVISLANMLGSVASG